MNEDSFNALERRLADLRPAALSPDVTEHIARRLGELPLTWGDRLLAGSMAAGALAAALIFAIILLSAAAGDVPARSDGAHSLAQERIMQEYDLLLARQ